MRRLLQILPAILLLFQFSTQDFARRSRTTETGPQESRLPVQIQPVAGAMQVHAQWSPQPGVSRFRFQLARDLAFSDIVVDRVVSATETEVADLDPGKYYWRVAPLTRSRGEFSSPRSVDAFHESGPGPAKTSSRAPLLLSEDGWQAAIGNIAHPLFAHLRTAVTNDLVAMNADGVVFAVDTASGVTLWATRASVGARRAGAFYEFTPIVLPSRGGVENVLLPFEGGVRAVQGFSGRELWRMNLPTGFTNGVSVNLTNANGAIFLIDNSRQNLIVIDADGTLVAQAKLPARAFGRPVSFDYRGIQGVMIALENGQIEILNSSGSVIHSGNANSSITTPPLFVGGSKPLILVGTKGGLTAFDADELRPLGRVRIKDDAPRGLLASADLDHDGAPKVIMITERGHVLAISAADGKILWDREGAAGAEMPAFVDLNRDGTLDVVVASGPAFAMVLSGRDGTVIWKAAERPGLANHASSLAPRTLVTTSSSSGTLIIGGDPAMPGLRAVRLSPAPPGIR